MAEIDSKLPKPQIIDGSTFEDVLAALVNQFKGLAPNYSELLESDPIQKVLESYAYREWALRMRLNSAIEANMLAFSTGTDLDTLGGFYGVSRQVIQKADPSTQPPTPEILETDNRLRSRINDRIRGWSTAGGAYHYKFWVREGIPEIRDVDIDSPEGGLIRIFVMSNDGDGVPTDELITKATAQVNRDDVKVLTDTVQVLKAEGVTIHIDATVHLLRDTPVDVYNNLESNFSKAFERIKSLGRDVTQTWIISNLSPDGVHSVTLTLPDTDYYLTSQQFPILGSINLKMGIRK